MTPEEPRLNGIDLSRLVSTDMQLSQGDVSRVEVLRDATNDRLYVKKTWGEGLLTHLPQVATLEYPEVGFSGSMRIRSMMEQAAHMKNASALGLGVVAPVYADEETLIYPYTPGESLRERLIHGETEGIAPALISINKAHKKNVIHGDRWAKNIIIGEDGKVTHVDFDIALEGANAREMEIAQILYDFPRLTMEFETTIANLISFMQLHASEYDWPVVQRLVKGYETFYTEHPIGKTWRFPFFGVGEK